jgi:N-dimethylarginine dimethylaminohydrolase
MYRFLMCAPEYFGVEYVINPWMEGKLGGVVGNTAHSQWRYLHHVLTQGLGAEVALVPPQPGLPDIVFTANAATVRNGVAVPSRFRYPERQGEEPFYRTALIDAGYSVQDLPTGVSFEGAGDALFYEGETDKPLLYAAHGFRTDLESHPVLAEAFGADVISVRLVDPRFYHLDTCFCALPGGYAIWYPPAFDAAGQGKIMASIPDEKLYAVSDEDAEAFACNAIGVGTNVVMNSATQDLRDKLLAWGFTTHITPLSEFIKAGGSSKCLTLRLG